MKAILEPIIALAAVVGIVLGGMAYFAKADDLQLVELRLDQKIVSDQVRQVQQRVWTLEERNKDRPYSEWSNTDEKKEYKALKDDLEMLKVRQKELIKK